MSNETSATSVDDVDLPVRLVELASLKTKAGAPVRVQCERIDELAIASIAKAWPGAHPSGMHNEDVRSTEEQLVEVNKLAAPLISAATVLLAADGSEVRPAFYFGDKPHGSKAINGRLLKQGDRVLLLTTILELSGYGGAADNATFPVE